MLANFRKRSATVGLAVLLMSPGICSATDTPTPATMRQQQIEKSGAAVMPFDINRTLHVFHPLADGGMQRVVLKNPTDVAQLPPIRNHLRSEALRFAKGDYGDPAAIHGAAMPGLAELHLGYRRIAVMYADVPGGGSIRYKTSDPAMIVALHRWFAAQSSDHGAHAMHDMPGMKM